MLATAAFGAIGFARRLPEDRPALAPRPAAPLQDGRGRSSSALAVGVALLMLAHHEPPLYNTRLIFPFFKRLIPGSRAGSMCLFAVVVLVGATNAVNLTDGLDGLAISTFAVSAAAFTALAYVTGHAVFANYLLLVRLPPARRS